MHMKWVGFQRIVLNNPLFVHALLPVEMHDDIGQQGARIEWSDRYRLSFAIGRADHRQIKIGCIGIEIAVGRRADNPGRLLHSEASRVFRKGEYPSDSRRGVEDMGKLYFPSLRRDVGLIFSRSLAISRSTGGDDSQQTPRRDSVSRAAWRNLKAVEVEGRTLRRRVHQEFDPVSRGEQ